MVQAIQTRDAPRVGWRLPLPRLRLNPTTTGLVLVLGAWLLQVYVGSFVEARNDLRRSIQQCEMQREMWLIEYNASLMRTPRSDRVTARAAFHVVENTRELFALSDIAQAGPFTSHGAIVSKSNEDIAAARALFEERNFAALVGELNDVSQIHEERMKAQTIGAGADLPGMRWWQHAFPILFLIGVWLCWKGARRRSAAEY